MTNNKPIFLQREEKNYYLEFRIGKADLTAELKSVRIVSSITNPYQVIFVSVFVDLNKMLLNESFTQENPKLIIKSMPVLGLPLEVIEFDLLVLDSQQNSVSQRSSNLSKNQVDRTMLNLICVPKSAFKIMNTTVNKIFIMKNIKEILTYLISSCGGIATIDNEEINPSIIDQVCIPPMTLYKAIREVPPQNQTKDTYSGFLDKLFGLYNGISAVFCNHENKVFVKNLSREVNKKQRFLIYQVMSESNTKEISSKSTSKESIFTTSEVKTKYVANAKKSRIGDTTNFIVKPRDTLKLFKNFSYDSVANNSGIIAGRKKVFSNPSVSVRDTWINSHPGYEYTDTFARTAIAKTSAELSSISIIVNNFPQLTLMMNVGVSVKFLTETIEYVSLSGNYIYKSSDIVFSKDKSWTAQCNVSLMRTNVTI